jgi:2-oxo-3-hexenedioate decarboxylase/2-keto-4-pentenoate hydratase
LTDLDPQQKAERIVELFRSRQPTEILPAEVYPANLDQAYAIRRAFQEIEEATGRGGIAGYKIGLTTPVMQQLCGIAEPCYGAIFAREVHDCRAELRAGDYCRIGVETEIVLRLGDDLSKGGDVEGIAAAVESAAAAIELIEDLRYNYRRLDASAMVAGNVWSAGAILGAPVTDWLALDLARAMARLSINGLEVGSGVGSDVMGHPVNALAWLAGKLADAGTPLRRGMIVMTGSMVPIQHPLAGDRVVVEVSGLGAAELVLT